MKRILGAQDKLSSDNVSLKQNVMELKETSQRVESMLRAILRARKIKWEENYVDGVEENEQVEFSY